MMWMSRPRSLSTFFSICTRSLSTNIREETIDCTARSPSFCKQNRIVVIPTRRSSQTTTTVISAAAEALLSREKMSTKVTADSIIWVDCEMSGLDVETETIMEIACIITGPNLDVIARQEPLIIKTADNILDSMGPWCQQHHGDSGLTAACRKSDLTVERADTILTDFVSLHTKAGTCPLAGNSIYMDRKFIQKYMPKFHQHLHYRHIDVSTIKELTRRWFPREFSKTPEKKFEHRTMSDIEESIKELAYYRAAVFKQGCS